VRHVANKERTGVDSWWLAENGPVPLDASPRNALSLAFFDSQRSQTSLPPFTLSQPGRRDCTEVALRAATLHSRAARSPSRKSCVFRLTGDSRKPPEAHHLCWVYLHRSSPSAVPVSFLFRRALRKVWPPSDPRTMTPILSTRSSESSMPTR
jgi:hypothetical protein